MGYDVHITRRRLWSDQGRDVDVAEWLEVVHGDPELRLEPELGPYFAVWTKSRRHKPWLSWGDGLINAKNPDQPLIDKMIAIATVLHAKVQGDDGESYDSAGAPPRPYEPSLVERLCGLLHRLRPTKRPMIPLPPFAVGDRVATSSGDLVTVAAIDPSAMHGYGTITVRDDTGHHIVLAMFGHGLRQLGADKREPAAEQRAVLPESAVRTDAPR
jgi:hypothetical protein